MAVAVDVKVGTVRTIPYFFLKKKLFQHMRTFSQYRCKILQVKVGQTKFNTICHWNGRALVIHPSNPMNLGIPKTITNRDRFVDNLSRLSQYVNTAPLNHLVDTSNRSILHSSFHSFFVVSTLKMAKVMCTH